MAEAPSISTSDPEFKLRASDPFAVRALEYYAALVEMDGGAASQARDARQVAQQMSEWVKRGIDEAAADEVAKARAAKVARMQSDTPEPPEAA